MIVAGSSEWAEMRVIGEDLLRRGEDEALAYLARRVIRSLHADAKRYLDQAIGLLSGGRATRSEADRIRDMLDAATPPSVLAAAPVAPARGPMRLVENVVMLQGGAQRYDGVHGRRLDPLSLMCRRAWVRHEAAGGKADGFTAPFTPGQIAMALHYQALVERHGAAGMKCASVEARGSGGGGGSGGGFIEAYIQETNEIASIRKRVSVKVDHEGFERDWIALDVKRVSASGQGRRAIPAMDLVDMVMLHDADLTEVLRRFGWKSEMKHRTALRAALASALDRAQGYHQKGD